MANTAFDPLRDDPFNTNGLPQPVAITPVSSSTPGTSSAWGLMQDQPVVPPQDDVLLHFNASSNNPTISDANKNSISGNHDYNNPKDYISQYTKSADSSVSYRGMTVPGPTMDSNPTTTSNISRSRTASMASAAGISSAGSRSTARSGGSRKVISVLDDMTIAPPPEKPVAKDYTLSLFHAEAETGQAYLPNWNQIKHSGTCLARISLRTLIMKKWKPIFWITYGEHTMLFFKSRFHFEDWAMDPNLSNRQREALVKLRVDFLDPNLSTRKNDEHILGFQASTIKVKNYKSKGMVHQFKLDKWTDQGPSINAAFGSETEEDVRELHLIMSAMLVKSPSSVAMVNYTDSRYGDDSSGYFMTDHHSSRSNPNVVHPYSSADDERSHYSGRSRHSGRSHNSASSTGSRSKYFLNNLKATVSRS